MRLRGLLRALMIRVVVMASIGTQPAHAYWQCDDQQCLWYNDPVAVEQYATPPAHDNSGMVILVIVGCAILFVMACASGGSEPTNEDGPCDADSARDQIQLLDLTQKLRAQSNHGDQYHDLHWRLKIGDQVLRAAEQEAVLDEHRERLADRSRRGRAQLLAHRAELRADGADTSEIDAALLGKGRRS